MAEKSCKVRRYFAAANGYTGFRSYFGEIFSPREFKRVYIIKGGPGTGKSSLMKRVMEELSEGCDGCDVIYCSSDPNSLDGIILRKGETKIALLDGTSPHTTDPTLPGACERIINLGLFWNEDELYKRRAHIEKINEIKSDAYRMAYSYLSVAGSLTKIRDGIVKSLLGERVLEEAEKHLPKAGEQNNKRIRLSSGFGKGGISYLDSFAEDYRRVYCVGLYGSELILLSEISSELSRRRASYTVYPSVFDEKKCDAIEVDGTSTVLIAALPSIDANEVIDTSTLLDSEGLKRERTRLELLTHEREVMLWAATDEFKKASDAHFELEDIYTSSMDFIRQGEYISELVGEIRELLNK